MNIIIEDVKALSRQPAHDAQDQIPDSQHESFKAEGSALAQAQARAKAVTGVEDGIEDGDLDGMALETLIVERLDDDKAQEIVCIDLRGKSSVADTLIIASGRSHRHVGALADHVLRALKEKGFGKAKVEGLPACDWVLIDVGDVVVHLFRPEVRAFYNIEKIWSVSATGTGHSISTTN
jgi:ribosome-associated protein